MANIGTLKLRSPTEEESKRLSRILRGKVGIAEWLAPGGAEGVSPVRFLVLPTPEGRRFDLIGCLNGWRSRQKAVEDMCKLGLQILEVNGLEPPDEVLRDLALLFLHMEEMPHLKEFRSRAYRYVLEYKHPTAEGIGLMPQWFLDPLDEASVGGVIDRKAQLERVTEEVFAHRSAVSLLSQLALYAADFTKAPELLDSDGVWEVVTGSILAGEVSQEEVEEARTSRSTERILGHMEKVARQEQKDLTKVFDRLRSQGFRDLAEAVKDGGPINRDEIRRNFLCMMVASFWRLSKLWCAALQSVKNLISPPLEGLETLMFDRMYLPQDYLAGLPAYLLWPREDIIIPLTLRFLTSSPEESGRLYMIPHCLKSFTEMDDFIKDRDRRRHGLGGKLMSQENAPEQGIEDVPREVDVEVLNELLSRLADLKCPQCGKTGKGEALRDPPRTGKAILKLSCGCVIQISDYLDPF